MKQKQIENSTGITTPLHQYENTAQALYSLPKVEFQLDIEKD